MQLPLELFEAIEREAQAIHPRELAAAARSLSEKYMGGSGAVREAPLANDVILAAYAVVRLPATYAAAHAALAALAERAPGLTLRTLLDLGAGLGAASWAAMEVFPSIERATPVERDAAAIAMGQRLAESSGADLLCEADWRRKDLKLEQSGDLHDLVIISYALGELPEHARPRLLEAAWAAAGQALVIVEPGTPAGFDVIAAAREAFIAMDGSVAAPCPHDAVCPLRGGGGAWCHFSQRLARSRRHRQAKGGDLGWEDEKYSYVALLKDRAIIGPASGARIITTPHVSKGGVDLELCAKSGIEKLTIPRRSGEAYKRAKKSNWGDWWK